jgi:hypothetical protein
LAFHIVFSFKKVYWIRALGGKKQKEYFRVAACTKLNVTSPFSSWNWSTGLLDESTASQMRGRPLSSLSEISHMTD